MINANITLSQIDYVSSFQNLIPKIAAAKGDPESHQPLFRFLGKMGDKASVIFLEIIQAIPEQYLDEILLWLLEEYKPQLIQQTNAFFQQDPLMKSIAFKGFKVEKGLEYRQHAFTLENIMVNYGLLISKMNPQERQEVEIYTEQEYQKEQEPNGTIRLPIWVKNAAKRAVSIAAVIAHNPIDRQCVTVLEKPWVKKILLSQLTAAMESEGIYMTLDNITFSYTNDSADTPATVHKPDLMAGNDLSAEAKHCFADAFSNVIKKHLIQKEGEKHVLCEADSQQL